MRVLFMMYRLLFPGGGGGRMVLHSGAVVAMTLAATVILPLTSGTQSARAQSFDPDRGAVIRGEPIPADVAPAMDNLVSEPQTNDAAAAGVDGWSARTFGGGADRSIVDQQRSAARPGDREPHSDRSGARAVERRGELAALARQVNTALQRKDWVGAQELLEHIVATAPHSPEAAAARQRLAALYRGETAEPMPEAGQPTREAAHAPTVGPGDRIDPRRAVVSSPLPGIEPAPERTFGAGDGGDGMRHGQSGAAAGTGDAVTARAPDVLNGGAPAPADSPAHADRSVMADRRTPKPWRPQARSTFRFEELLRADVGDRIFFGAASAEVGTRARAVLERQAQWLARYPDLYVVVEGHADDPGEDAGNDALARERAETARARLVAAGVAEDRIDIDVRGRRERAVVCEEPTCRSQNRRAVTRLMLVLPAAPRSALPTPGRTRAQVADDARPRQGGANAPPER